MRTVFTLKLCYFLSHLVSQFSSKVLCGSLASLRSRRFRLVSEQKNRGKGIFGFDRAKNEENQKMKEGEGGGEGRKRLQTNP